MKLIALSGKSRSGKDTVADMLVTEKGFAKIALADPLKRFCKEVYGFSYEQLWGPSEERNRPDERYLKEIKTPPCLWCVNHRKGTPSTHATSELRFLGPSNPEILTYCEDHVPASHSPAACRAGHAGCQELLAKVTKPVYLTPREAIQKLGTEWGRGLYEDTWVEYLLGVVELLDRGESFIYTPEFGLERALTDYQGVVVPDARYENEFTALRKAGAVMVRVKRTASGIAGERGQHPSETEQDRIPDEAFDHVLENEGTLEDLKMKVMALAEVV